MKGSGSQLPEICILNRQRAVKVNLKWLRKFADLALPMCAEESADGLFTLKELEEVVLTIVGDKKIAQIHMDFMNVPGPTDVITFQHGEIVVSAQTAVRYAGEQGHSAHYELALYLVHGLLHLNAHEDGTPELRERMHEVQDGIWRRCLLECPEPVG